MNPYTTDDEAKEELKRADHLVYVTLKYTRTADVIYNTVKRLIAAFEFSFLKLVNYLKEIKRIPVVPDSAQERTDLILKSFRKVDLRPYIQLYEHLKELERSDYVGREEFRKHVTMIATMPNKKKFEVDIPVILDYYNKTKEFDKIIDSLIK